MENETGKKKEVDIKEEAEKRRSKGITFIIIGIVIILMTFYVLNSLSIAFNRGIYIGQ
jgi:hypothetical protein